MNWLVAAVSSYCDFTLSPCSETMPEVIDVLVTSGTCSEISSVSQCLASNTGDL